MTCYATSRIPLQKVERIWNMSKVNYHPSLQLDVLYLFKAKFYNG